MLRIKQTNGLDFSTALPTSPRRLPILPQPVFHEVPRAARPWTTDDKLPSSATPTVSHGHLGANFSAASIVTSDSSRLRDASGSGTAPYPAYHFAALSFLASIRRAPPPTSAAASKQRLPAASKSCPPRPRPCTLRCTARRASRKTGTS